MSNKANSLLRFIFEVQFVGLVIVKLCLFSFISRATNNIPQYALTKNRIVFVKGRLVCGALKVVLYSTKTLPYRVKVPTFLLLTSLYLSSFRE